MAVLNLAVDMDRLDKNRLKRLPVPDYVKRERVIEGWEFLKILSQDLRSTIFTIGKGD